MYLNVLQVGVNSVNPADAWVFHSDVDLIFCKSLVGETVGSQVALDMAETSEHGGSNVQDEEVGWIAVQQGAYGFTAGTGGILK